MTIGIYKPFKEIMFVDDRLDNAAWSYEMVNIAQIYAERGHNVVILSQNDLHKDTNKVWTQKGIYDWSDKLFNSEYMKTLDRVMIWCGSFELDKYQDEIIQYLRAHTDRLDFFLTDKKLAPMNTNMLGLFDNIYVQGTLSLYSTNDKFGALGELLPYNFKYTKTIDEVIASKEIEFYFGGTERNRLDDFIEYVWRPGHLITTKTAFFNFENRIPRDEFMTTLDKAKYSVVITDVENNELHFISPRPYELYMHDIIAFFDYKYDADKHFDVHQFCIVRNYKEMRQKMNEINNNVNLQKEILEHQRKQITKNIVNGNYVYNMTK